MFNQDTSNFHLEKLTIIKSTKNFSLLTFKFLSQFIKISPFQYPWHKLFQSLLKYRLKGSKYWLEEEKVTNKKNNKKNMKISN